MSSKGSITFLVFHSKELKHFVHLSIGMCVILGPWDLDELTGAFMISHQPVQWGGHQSGVALQPNRSEA